VAFRRREGLAWQEVDGEGILVDLEGGRMMGMNRAALLVWSLAPEKHVEGIAAALAGAFDTDLDTARRDTADFLARLVDRGLLFPE
jgi:hypothetical protein